MSDPFVRTIRLRWQGRCCLCGEELPPGDSARWDRRRRTVTCLSCAGWSDYGAPGAGATAGTVADLLAGGSIAGSSAVGPPSTLGVAGASALREYMRRRDSRERRAHERAGALGVWLTRLRRDPASVRAWKRGAEGEQQVAGQLVRLLEGSDVHLLHDRRLPASRRANIDHLAVGPGGVTVIDAKALSGKIRVETVDGLFGTRHQLRVRGRDRTKLVYGVRGQAEAVRALLTQHDLGCDVRCALCFADANGLPLLRRQTLEEVVIDGPRRVAKLARRPGPHGRHEIERMVRVLAEGLPAA